MEGSAAGRATIAVANGTVTVHGTDADSPALLSWPDAVEVRINGAPAPGREARVRSGDVVEASAHEQPGDVDYRVDLSRDRLEARLTVKPRNGVRHTLVDVTASSEVELSTRREELPAPEPDAGEAAAAVGEAGVVVGVDRDAIKRAVIEVGRTFVIATGDPMIPGEDGQLEELVDWRAAWRDGVRAGTELMRRIPSTPGTPGRDVTGRELAPPKVKDPKMRAGGGCEWQDEAGHFLVATIDGSAVLYSSEARVEVSEELVVRHVDTELGDLDFIGSVRVEGNVDQGRTVRAGKDIAIRGNVDRARVECAGNVSVDGTVMSSHVRAGADRAVFAGIVDDIREVPGWLGELATRAAELTQAAQERGQPLSFGLAIQVIVERMYARLMRGLSAAADHLREAGERHREMADAFSEWHRVIRTSANSQISGEQFRQLVSEICTTIGEIRAAVEQPSDVHINYMQAGEIEATGTVTITGKGIFNSRIVAWSGLRAEMPTAVVRGGTIICHGPVHVHALGSPGGALMKIVLGAHATLDADLVHAGTVVQARYGSHRFIADRTDVHIGVDESGLDVQSFAA